MLNRKRHLINTSLVGLAVVTLSLTMGRTAEAKTLNHALEGQPETQLVALKFKKFKKIRRGRRKFRKVHHGHDKFHGHHKFHGKKKFIGHQKFHHGHHFR